MRTIIHLLGVLLSITAMGADAPAPENLQLFLLVGQSNMAGRGVVESQDKVPHPRIFMLNKELAWVPATDPVHFDKPIAGVGLASEFARVLAEKDPSAKIGLIPCAVGGTSLDQWKPGEVLYRNAVDRAREGMKRGKLAGILWHQGEADSGHQNVLTYGDRLQAMVQQLREDLGAQDVPFLIGELGRFREAHAEFNANLPAVSRRIPKCALVTAEDLGAKPDGVHFDAAALRAFGRRYAAAYLRLQGGQ